MPFYSFFAYNQKSAVPTLTFAPFSDNTAAFRHAESLLANEPCYRRIDVLCGEEELGSVGQSPQTTSFIGFPAPTHRSANSG
jgi:hypothetical protein